MNKELQAARLRTASVTHPGESLSRRELAVLINEHMWSNHGLKVQTDANYIGKLERGAIRWPGTQYREALRTILGAESDAELGFHNARRSAQTPRAAVDEWRIDQIERSARAFMSWQHVHGGWAMREAMLAEMRHATRMLDSSFPARLRRPLSRAVAQLAHTCGYSAFDIGDHGQARDYFTFALSCAERSGDHQIRASILASAARQACSLGAPGTGLARIEQALAAADRLTATEQAMLYAVKSRCLAILRDVPGTIRASGEADARFADSSPGDDPPWMRYYDKAQHCGDTGTAMLTLAVLGHLTEARDRITVAFKERNDAYPRSRTLAQIRLATLDMATGDPHEAVANATDALGVVGTIRSNQIVESLKTLNRFTVRRKHLAAVRPLHDRLVRVLEPGGPRH